MVCSRYFLLWCDKILSQSDVSKEGIILSHSLKGSYIVRKCVTTRKVWQQELQSSQAYAEVCLPGESRTSQIDNPVKLATS